MNDWFETGVSLRKIGKEYGVSHTTIRHALVGKSWKHIKK